MRRRAYWRFAVPRPPLSHYRVARPTRRPPADPSGLTRGLQSDLTVSGGDGAGAFPPPRTAPHRARVDVAIVGGGFAGSLAASCLLAAGRTVAVIERGSHPRFAVGESSTPATNIALRAIADRFDLRWLAPLTRHGSWAATHPALRVGRKRGFAYFHHAPGAPFDPGEDHAAELLVLASATPAAADVHWNRADFDAYLAARAVAAGAIFYDRTELKSLLDRPTRGGAAARYELKGVRAEEPTGAGGPVTVAADFLIDAGGPGGALRQLLALPDATALLKTRTAAVYAHLNNLEPWEATLDGLGCDRADHPFPAGEAAVHHLLPGGWNWELRFDDGTTSVGRVAAIGGKPPSFDPADPFGAAAAPTLSRRYAASSHAAPAGGPVRTGRLQRRTGRVAGDRYALLPSAAGFVDPLHSTGTAHAAAGVLRLCTLLDRHWGRPSLPAALKAYGQRVNRELDRIDGLVAPCYAAMPDRETFQLAVLPYFAAATRGERGATVAESPADGDYLLADDPAFTAAVEGFAARLGRDGPGELRAALRKRLEPWDAVGLFDPAVPNMHVRTAAPAG